MNIKQTIRNVVLGAVFVFGIALAALPVTVNAETCVPTETTQCCGGVQTSIIGCEQTGGDNKDVKNSGLWGLLIIVINILTAGVGVLALGGIIYGAVLYTSAGGSTEQVKKAYTVFTNVVIGVVAFAGMWALLNFLIPGGVFNQL